MCPIVFSYCPLYCLSFDLPLLITPLVSSNCFKYFLCFFKDGILITQNGEFSCHLFQYYINVRENRRAIKNVQSGENGKIGPTRRRKTKQKYNTVCVWHQYTQTRTKNVNKTWHSSVNGHFRVETTELRRVHVHSSLLVVTSNQNASNKEKIV